MKKNVIAACGFAILIAGPLAYLLSDRTHPYEYLSGDVLPPDPSTGSQISIHWRVRYNRFCPGWVQREITDRRGYVWFNVGSAVKQIAPVTPGHEADIVNTMELPRQLGPGPATYRAYVSYRCNFLQSWVWPITVSTPALPFEIVGHTP